MTFKEGGASKKSGKDKSVRICRPGEGRNRSTLHRCNALGTYPSAV